MATQEREEAGKRWEAGELQEALGVLMDGLIDESVGSKRPSTTTVQELLIWNGARVKAAGKSGLGRARLRQLTEHAGALTLDGHAEGEMLQELLDEVQRLRRRGAP